jgi:hypothetical protein
MALIIMNVRYVTPPPIHREQRPKKKKLVTSISMEERGVALNTSRMTYMPAENHPRPTTRSAR